MITNLIKGFHFKLFVFWGGAILQTSAYLAAEDVDRPAPGQIRYEFVGDENARDQVPGKEGKFRLYLNREVGGEDLNKLDTTQQAIEPPECVFPIVRGKQLPHTTWSGDSPFELLDVKEIELWLRLHGENFQDTEKAIIFWTVEQGSSVIAQSVFTITKKELNLGDDQFIQVLVRYPVENKRVKKGSQIKISFMQQEQYGRFNTSLVSYGCSHIEFRDAESKQPKLLAIFGIRSLIDTPADIRSPMTKTGPAISSKLKSQLETEAVAQNKLKLAKALLTSNRSAGKRRLEEIVKLYPGTESAKAAEKLMKSQ